MFKIIIVVIAVALVVYLIRRSSITRKKALENMQTGKEFLEANKKADGVQTTASGLQYKVLTQGSGSEHPGPSDLVKVHYHGTLINGRVFDSSVDRGEPITFGLSQVIKGWQEGLQLMVVGDKTRLFIPSELAYGNRDLGVIGPGTTLIFDVELLGINE